MIIDYWFIVEAVISLKYIHDKNDTFLIVLKRARNKIILQQLLHPIYRRFELLNSSVAVVWKLCGLIEAILLLAWVDSDKKKKMLISCVIERFDVTTVQLDGPAAIDINTSSHQIYWLYVVLQGKKIWVTADDQDFQLSPKHQAMFLDVLIWAIRFVKKI